MERVRTVDYFYQMASEVASPACVPTWADFFNELDMALEKCEITEEEYTMLMEMFPDRDEGSMSAEPLGVNVIDMRQWPTSVVSSVSKAATRFATALAHGQDTDGFERARELMCRVTGVEFSTRVQQTPAGVVVSLHHSAAEKDSVICASQISQTELDVTLCCLDTIRFCQEFKISTLHAKDAWKLFLSSLEPLAQYAGFKVITMRGTEMSDDRQVELMGYTKAHTNKDKTETWEKLFE